MGCGHSSPCNCLVESGHDTEVTGNGSAENPYIISATSGGTYLKTVDTSSVVWRTSGEGTVDDPLVLAAGIVPVPLAPVTVTRFPASGTWTKPAGVTTVLVRVLGAGGGGGSGHRLGTTGTAYPGVGGGGGGYSDASFTAADLPATVAVTVGVGGNGGVAPVAAGNGAAGAAGGASSFGTLLSAGGGPGGIGGSPGMVHIGTPGGYGESLGGPTPQYAGYPTAGYKRNYDPSSRSAGGGAGGIGGMPGSIGNSGAEGSVAQSWFAPGGTTASAAARQGKPGVTPWGVDGLPTGLGGGGGGGGAGGSSASNASDPRGGTGGAGGRGGGGGGGGGLANANTGANVIPGAGGKGGDGYVMVIAW